MVIHVLLFGVQIGAEPHLETAHFKDAGLGLSLRDDGRQTGAKDY